MDKVIQTLEDRETKCEACGGKALFRSFIVKETKPHKVIMSTHCDACGAAATTEDDCELLEYGVKITCDFTKNDNSSADLRRMAFLNNHANVSFYKVSQSGEESEIFSFSTEKCNVDCIEGMMMRGDDILDVGCGLDGDKAMKRGHSEVKEILKGKGFKLVITDNSGYSKVCPLGKEYTDVQDCTFDELNKMDSTVRHEKIDKKSNH